MLFPTETLPSLVHLLLLVLCGHMTSSIAYIANLTVMSEMISSRRQFCNIAAIAVLGKYAYSCIVAGRWGRDFTLFNWNWSTKGSLIQFCFGFCVRARFVVQISPLPSEWVAFSCRQKGGVGVEPVLLLVPGLDLSECHSCKELPPLHVAGGVSGCELLSCQDAHNGVFQNLVIK